MAKKKLIDNPEQTSEEVKEVLPGTEQGTDEIKEPINEEGVNKIEDIPPPSEIPPIEEPEPTVEKEQKPVDETPEEELPTKYPRKEGHDDPGPKGEPGQPGKGQVMSLQQFRNQRNLGKIKKVVSSPHAPPTEGFWDKGLQDGMLGVP